jgi:hypothetical protein
VQSDPIGLGGGLNPYLYANGNPLDETDPLGYLSESTRQRLARLRELGEAFQKKIADFCPEDRSQIEQIFGTWVVSVDPNIDDPVRRALDLAVSNFDRRATQFNDLFFANPGAQGFVLRHEFRHLMPANNALRRQGDVGLSINPNGDTSKLPSEKDVDAWARYSGADSCKCKYDR